ncbi:MAG: hypothetical protein ACPGVZ_17980 [Myxococcota bacterium]
MAAIATPVVAAAASLSVPITVIEEPAYCSAIFDFSEDGVFAADWSDTDDEVRATRHSASTWAGELSS